MRRGALEIDLMIAFILIMFMFYTCTTIESKVGSGLSASLSLQSNVALKIARSYEVLSQICTKRDNEILLSALVALAPQNVSLKTSAGYVYGGQFNSLCIERAVYIRDVEDVGILEVC